MKINSVILQIVFVSFCFLILGFLLVASIFKESPVYDEILHVNAGYQFLTKQDFRVEPFNPPLAREVVALPLLFNPKLQNDLILFWPRLMVVIFTLALAVLVYLFSQKLYGPKAAFFALLLFVFEPNILAHGHYATTDMILAFFISLSVFLFWLWRKTFTVKRIVLFAVVFGLALSTKVSALPFLTFSLAIITLLTKKEKQAILNLSYWQRKIPYLLLFFFISLSALWATYFFTFEPPLGLRFDSERRAIELAKTNPWVKFALTQPVPLGSYLSSVKQVFLYNYSDRFSKDAFLLGQISSNGFLYYFPIVFLIKTPLPFILLLFTSLILRLKANKNNLYLLVPVATIFTFMIFSRVNLGVRYILPVYPLMVVFISQIVNLTEKRGGLWRWIMVILLFWYTLGTLRAFPYYISFFNEVVGGSQNGYKYLVDSNLDWGQGLIALKNYQKKNNITNLQLAYFGTAKPSTYGIKYERIKDSSLSENQKITKIETGGQKILAISATCWYSCGYYKDPKTRNLKLKEIIGGSILIFKEN